MLRFISLLSLLAIACAVHAQTPYPPTCVQDVQWSSGDHPLTISNAIHAPCSPSMPVSILASATAELVSGTEVHLQDGFHAGDFDAEGRFRASIQQAWGVPADLVVIPSDPGAQVVDGLVYVGKWEKLEVGLRLPQVYQAAVDSFFVHYYSNGTNSDATPQELDVVHDLNPYADDSLQLVMTLISPSGVQKMKWGFYMREAIWANGSNLAKLVEDQSSVLHPYPIRFRVAPDEEGEWYFGLSIQAPHTRTPDDVPLPALHVSGHSFICTAPRPDNKGHLRVDSVNRRVLKFETGEPFFGLGVNMANVDRDSAGYGWGLHQRDAKVMQQTMAQLHEVGGNFMRMYMLEGIFSPEYVNLGVYDAYRIPPVCDQVESIPCPDLGWATGNTGNCQFQCWAFDRMLDTARAHNIHIQLCIDAYPPIVAYEKAGWGAHPYVINFLDPHRQAPPLNPYDMKEFFFTPDTITGQPMLDRGVFYYWKRKYKYIMSRWGYSVNIAAIEPFNEIDQMLSYCPAGQVDSLASVGPVASCDDLDLIDHRDICRENRAVWARDPDLPATISQWLTHITDHVRSPVVPENPVTSPLGESEKLFLMSYTGGVPYTDMAFHLPFTNPAVDLLDVHQYAFPQNGEQVLLDWRIHVGHDVAQGYRNTYQSSMGAEVYKKPFNLGEYCYSTNMVFGPPNNTRNFEIEKLFLNYDVSFHNEIWSTAFSGNFATGLSWHWGRIFWWKDALPKPPIDNFNEYQGLVSNILGTPNRLDIGIGTGYVVVNRRLHHHFRPLADLLAHPSWTPYSFFSGNYTAHDVFDFTPQHELESYYLKNEEGTVAIGWVHNRNAWVMKNYYLASGGDDQNLLGCDPPNAQSQTLTLTGFETGTYFVTWFPTRMNSTVHPPQAEVATTTGTLVLDLTGQFGGTANNYLDTLRSDYAFIITPAPFVKSRPLPIEEVSVGLEWDFTLYPNPACDGLFLGLPSDVPKVITLSDVAGRRVLQRMNITAPIYYLPVGHLAKGTYWVHVSDGMNMRVKKLIIG